MLMLLKLTFLFLLDEAKRLWERKNLVNFVKFSVNSVLLFLSPSSQSIHQVHKIKIFKTFRFLKLCFYATYFVKPAILFLIILIPNSSYFNALGSVCSRKHTTFFLKCSVFFISPAFYFFWKTVAGQCYIFSYFSVASMVFRSAPGEKTTFAPRMAAAVTSFSVAFPSLLMFTRRLPSSPRRTACPSARAFCITSTKA